MWDHVTSCNTMWNHDYGYPVTWFVESCVYLSDFWSCTIQKFFKIRNFSHHITSFFMLWLQNNNNNNNNNNNTKQQQQQQQQTTTVLSNWRLWLDVVKFSAVQHSATLKLHKGLHNSAHPKSRSLTKGCWSPSKHCVTLCNIVWPTGLLRGYHSIGYHAVRPQSWYRGVCHRRDRRCAQRGREQ